MSQSAVIITLGSSRTFKPEQLRRVLRSLETDEGIRIEGPGERFKMYISKSPSGLFAAELVGKSSRRTGSRGNIQYLSSVNDVMSVIRTLFTDGSSFCVY